MRALITRLDRLEARAPSKYDHLSEPELDALIVRYAKDEDLPALMVEQMGWEEGSAQAFIAGIVEAHEQHSR
jgi:hypothetical protein